MIDENPIEKYNRETDDYEKNNTKKRHIKNNSEGNSIFNNILINELEFNVGKKSKTKKKKNQI